MSVTGELPIVRHAAVGEGKVIIAPKGITAIDQRTGLDRSVAPSIFVSASDTRSDDAIRAEIAGWQGRVQ